MDCFKGYFFNYYDIKGNGCGANALSLLTGINPEKYKTKNYIYSDNYMINKLRRKGFKVVEITKSNLTNDKEVKLNLDEHHLILYSALLKRGEASWFVTYGGYVWHNFSVNTLNSWEIMNYPIDSMYLLYKKINHL